MKVCTPMTFAVGVTAVPHVDSVPTWTCIRSSRVDPLPAIGFLLHRPALAGQCVELGCTAQRPCLIRERKPFFWQQIARRHAVNKLERLARTVTAAKPAYA